MKTFASAYKQKEFAMRAALALLLILTGCGGGGGSDAVEPSGDYQIGKSLTTLATTSSTWAARNRSSWDNLTLTLRLIPETVQRSGAAGFAAGAVIEQDGKGFVTSDSNWIYYSTEPFKVREIVTRSASALPTGEAPAVPATAQIGYSQRIFTGNVVNTDTTSGGQLTVDMTLEPSANGARLCLAFQTTDGVSNPYESYCFGVDPDGRVPGGFQAVLADGLDMRRERISFD